jgi:Hsp70 protein
VVGEPGGRDDLGGEDFDDRLYRFLGRRLDPEQWQTLIAPDSGRSWQRANYDFKKDVRRAKEHLSRYPDATVRTPIPDGEDIRVPRAEFECLIREDIETTVAELERTVEAAGHSVDDLAAIYLAGGSSRIPLIWRRIEQRLGKQPSTFGDPKAVIALGAARAQLRAGSKPATRKGADKAAVVGSLATPDIHRPPDTGEPATTTQKRQSLDRISAVGGAVALLGSALVILSEFLPRLHHKNLWHLQPSIRYPIIVAILALLVILLIATGLRRSRPALLVLATFVAAFLTASVVPLMIRGYSQFQSGVWIGILGGVLAATGSGIAARQDLGMADMSFGRHLAAIRAANLVAGLGLLVFTGSLFLARRNGGSTWLNLTIYYPLATTVLAAVGVWLVALELRSRCRTLGLTAVLSCFLLGEAVALALPRFNGLDIGFWMGILGALIAVVASAGTIMARSLAHERARSPATQKRVAAR